MPEPHAAPRLGRYRLRLDRQVYGTVVLMSVLVVYDGWNQLATFWGVAAVIVAPIVAMAAAHLFAEVLQEHGVLGRPLTRVEWAHAVRDQVSWFQATVPPLVMLGLAWVSPADALTSISIILWTSLATLVVLSAVAAHRAGLQGWRRLITALSGGVLGLIVISLQVVLKPH
jgi:hypothetical protein